MILCITGLPGAGKTLYALAYVKAWSEREAKIVDEGGQKVSVPREVHYVGIRDLQLPWTPLPSRVEKIGGYDVEVPVWWQAPAGSIVVIDEAQMRGFGKRQPGVMPEWGKLLETHRHYGIDIVFITQDVMNLDAHDRRLVERHFHVMRKFGGQSANVHEFKSGARDNAAKNRTGSVLHKFRYPKAMFAAYKSAEVHTHRRHIPMRVWLLMALPFLIGGVVWFTWAKYLDPHRKKDAEAVTPGQPGALPTAGPSGIVAKLSTGAYLSSFAPRVPGLAYTAPAYDEVTKPVEAPYPAACVTSSSKGCRCYTQQGTRLETPAELCKTIAEGGFFVAWAQKTSAPSAQQQRQPEPIPQGAAGIYGSPIIKPMPAVSVNDPRSSQRGGALSPPAINNDATDPSTFRP